MINSDFSWANGTVEGVATLIAERHKTATHEKRADKPPVISNQLEQIKQDMAGNAGQKATTTFLDSNLGSGLKWGLGGAAVGGLIGGLGSYALPKRKRRSAQDIATGALIGGLGGAGLGLVFGGKGDGKSEQGTAEYQIEKEQARNKALRKVERNDYTTDGEGKPIGFMESRLRDYVKTVPTAIEAAREGELAEAGRRIDWPGLRHLFNPELGDPISGKYGKGGFLGGITPTFHGDLALTTAGMDFVLSKIRKSLYFRDPVFTLRALTDPETVKQLGLTPVQAEAAVKHMSTMTDEQRVNFLKGYDSTGKARYNQAGGRDRDLVIEHTLPADRLRSAYSAHTDKSLIAKHVPATAENLKQYVNLRTQERLKPFAASNLISPTTNTLMTPDEYMATAGGSMAVPDDYIKRITSASPDLAALDAKLSKVPPAERAGLLYREATRLGDKSSLRVLQELNAIANNPDEFNKFTSNTVARDIPEDPIGAVKNQKGEIKNYLSKLSPITPDEVTAMGRDVVSPGMKLKLNLMTERAGFQGADSDAVDHLLKSLNNQELDALANQLSKPNAKGYTAPVLRLAERIVEEAHNRGIKLIDTDQKTNYGRLRRSFTGPGTISTSAPGTKLIAGMLQNKSAPNPPVSAINRGLGQNLINGGRRFMAHTTAVPRWAAYGLPLAVQEFLWHRGNQQLFGYTPYPDNIYGVPRALAETKDYRQFVDDDFTNQTNNLVKLLGDDAKLKRTDYTPRQKVDALGIISDKSLTSHEKARALRKILGFEK